MNKLNYEEKFIVINKKRFAEITELNFDARRFVDALLRAVENFSDVYEYVTGKKIDQKYYVCNQDEPYADKVRDIILNPSRANKSPSDGDDDKKTSKFDAMDAARDVGYQEGLKAALQSDIYREPDENTPDDAAIRYRWRGGVDKRWYVDVWSFIKEVYFQDPLCVDVFVLDQGPPSENRDHT